MSTPHGSGPLDAWPAGQPPWEIGRPQPAVAALAGAIRGRVLDVGCGTGEHTLMAAARGLDATGIDLADGALQAAGRPVPHGLSRSAVESCFADGWVLESLQPATCSSNFYADGVAGWLATVTRI